MTAIQAKNLTLGEVHFFLGFKRYMMASSFSSILSLAPLTQVEQQELTEI
jgi:hypothetical protein